MNGLNQLVNPRAADGLPPALRPCRRELFASRTERCSALPAGPEIGASLLGLACAGPSCRRSGWWIQATAPVSAVWALPARSAMAAGLLVALLPWPRPQLGPACAPFPGRTVARALAAQATGSPLPCLAFLASWPHAALGSVWPLQGRAGADHSPAACHPLVAGRWGRRPAASLLKRGSPDFGRCSICWAWPDQWRPGLVRVPPSEWGGLLLTVAGGRFRESSQVFRLVVLMALGTTQRAAPAALGLGGPTVEFVRGAR